MKKTDIKIGDLYQVGRLDQRERADLDGAGSRVMVGRVIREGVSLVRFTKESPGDGWQKYQHNGTTAWVLTQARYSCRYGRSNTPGWLVEIVTHPFDLAKSEPAILEANEWRKQAEPHWLVLQSRDIHRPWDQTTADNMIEEQKRRKRQRDDDKATRLRIGQAERDAREKVIDSLQVASGDLLRRLPYGFGKVDGFSLPSLESHYNHEVSLRWTMLAAIIEAVRND